jgi:superfamily II DNA or RNA helicase
MPGDSRDDAAGHGISRERGDRQGMQIPPSVHAGDLLEIRRHRWRVLAACAYERCQLLTVVGIGAANAGLERQFLAPFDETAFLDRARTPRFVRPRRWRHACRGLLADCTPPGALSAPRLARIDLLPHQLEPALAIVRGRGSRVLLADDVGLGKTIQAGLIIAELKGRGQADRVLIVTPSGLRDQWQSELADRFGIAAVIADFRGLRRRSSAMPVGLNPWITMPMAITSIDYLKRPEVLQSARACRWDVVVVDEAHGAGRGSDRQAAVSTLASIAAYVILLTATPHSGDMRAFASLCNIGALGDPLLVFRRTKSAVNLGTGRRVHRLQVRTSPAEARMHVLLEDFVRAVRSEHDSADACLALSVLHKRAFSSARSLELTLGRRLASLGPEAAGNLRQLALPLAGDRGELDNADDAPDCLAGLGLADTRRERSLLAALQAAAHRAVRDERKISALRRLIRRVAEPIVVFTEFRDTLLHLRTALRRPVLVLHGGLTRDERRNALDDFLHGRCPILLATDAAGEGLNLHHRCRLVVNLELPWNPVRLEQRIGRVDRIGQVRTVHAIHLIARDTAESRVLDRLKERIARAQAEIAVANPIEDDERAVAKAVLDPTDRPGRPSATPNAAPRATGDGDAQPLAAERFTVDLGREADCEVARLISARSFSSDAATLALARLEITGPWVIRARLKRSRASLGRRLLAILRIDHEDGAGRLFDWTLAAVSLALTGGERLGPERLKALLHRVGAHLRSSAEEASRRDRLTAGEPMQALLSARLARERRIAHAIVDAPRPVLQPGLFDRRAERAQLADSGAVRESANQIAARLEIQQRTGVVAPRPARLLLVLAP